MCLKLMSKFIIFTLLTVFLSASFIVGLDQVSHTLLTNYLFQSDYMIEQEKRPLKKLQVWINKNNVQTDDLIKLDNYCDEHQFPYLVIMKKGHVVYDWNLQDMVNTRLYPAVPGLEIDRLWRFYQPVHFKNGTAYVFIDNGSENHLYQLTTVMAAVLGVFLGMGAYVLYLKKKIKQIIYINDMVEKLRNKDYTHDIRVSGTDEIGELAAHVDILRQRLAEDVQKEKVIKEENYTMISGMVHDLRQPLANIQLYVDILSEKQEASRNVKRIRKNIKALQVLSDELFEYILLHNKEKVILEKPEKLFSAIGDDLSNMYAMLEEKEFHMNSPLPLSEANGSGIFHLVCSSNVGFVP